MRKRTLKAAVTAMGIDVGDKKSRICVLDAEGAVIDAKVAKEHIPKALHAAIEPILGASTTSEVEQETLAAPRSESSRLPSSLKSNNSSPVSCWTCVDIGIRDCATSFDRADPVGGLRSEDSSARPGRTPACTGLQASRPTSANGSVAWVPLADGR